MLSVLKSQKIQSRGTGLSLLILLFLLTACTPTIAPPPTESHTKTLRVALTAPVGSLDVTNAHDDEATVAWQLYDSLLFWRTDGAEPGGTLEPALATAWTSAPAADDPASTTYTFTLRTDVTFHNGEPFDAQAVVYSWQRGRRAHNLHARHWRIARRVEALDSHTVTITSDGPQPLFLRQIAQHWAMVPPHYIEQVGEEHFARQPVGTGPFQFVEWDTDGEITLAANRDYWRTDYPRLDRLVFRPIPTTAERLAALRAGTVDIVPRLSKDEADDLLDSPGMDEEFVILSYPINRVYVIAFNNQTADDTPLVDKRVRQALNYAVDVQAIIQEIFEGYARPSTGLVTPDNPGYDPLIQAYGYDPEQARRLLAAAGYANGFAVNMACPVGMYAYFGEVCTAVQRYLGKVGVTVHLEHLDPAVFRERQRNQALPPLYGDSRATSLGEALPRLNDALRVPESPLATWHDPVIRRYLARLNTSMNDVERAKLYISLQRYMKKNPPFLYLYEPVTFEAVRATVQNYAPRIDERYFLYDVDIQAAATTDGASPVTEPVVR